MASPVLGTVDDVCNLELCDTDLEETESDQEADEKEPVLFASSQKDFQFSPTDDRSSIVSPVDLQLYCCQEVVTPPPEC